MVSKRVHCGLSLALMLMGCGEEGAGVGEACETSADCRQGLVCNPYLGTCYEVGADSTPPALVSTSVSPATVTPGSTVVADFAVSEALGGKPIVRIMVTGIAPILMGFVSENASSYRYEYVSSGDEPAGSADVVAELADTVGNVDPKAMLGTVTFAP